VALCPSCEEKLSRLDRAGRTGVAPVTFAGTDPPDDGPAERDGSTEQAEPTERDEPTERAEPTGLRGLGADERGGGSSYRKALRLLGNREFPLERAAAVDLLSGAYDLDVEECERLVDLTVERGLLVEADGELRRA
jgi:hypothetical protein